MTESRAWSNLCFQARLIKAHDASASSRPSRTMLEAYLDGEAAVLIDCASPVSLTLLSCIRTLLAGAGGMLAAKGALAYRFNHVGRLGFAPGADSREIAAHARFAEAIINHADKCVEVLTDPGELGAVETQLARNGLHPALRGVVHRAWNAVAVPESPAGAEGLLSIAALDTVLGVYTDAVFTDEVLAQF